MLILCQAVSCVTVGKIYAVNLYKAVMRFFRAVSSNIAVDAPPSAIEGPRLHLALQPMHPAYSRIVYCPVVRLCISLQFHSGGRPNLGEIASLQHVAGIAGTYL